MALAGIPIATMDQKKVAVTRGVEKMMAIYCDRGENLRFVMRTNQTHVYAKIL